jgi:hypothetical protein
MIKSENYMNFIWARNVAARKYKDLQDLYYLRAAQKAEK